MLTRHIGLLYFAESRSIRWLVHRAGSDAVGGYLGTVECQLTSAKLINHDLAGLERRKVSGQAVLGVVNRLDLSPVNRPLKVVGGS